MKILFFATSEFAIPALEKLAKAGYDIAAVITQPDKPAGRKQEPLPSPVKVWALEHELKVLQPTSLQLSPSPGERVAPSFSLPKSWGGIKGEVEVKDIDVAVVASYGKIIPPEIFNLPKYGTLNIHPSLLPKYRGPSPIQAAILNGDDETGVTIIKLDEEMDHGPILANSKIQIPKSKIYFQELHDDLVKLGANLLIKILPDYIAGKIKPVPQDHSKATLTKIITKNDARIDWNCSAEQIWSMVRAYQVWPVAWTMLEGKRLKIFEAIALEKLETSPLSPLRTRRGQGEVTNISRETILIPGTIVMAENTITIQAGHGILSLQKLQLEGGKILHSQSFANGYRGLQGKILK